MIKKIIFFLCKKKYKYTLILFFIWILIFDNNNLFNQLNKLYIINKLSNQKIYYINKVKILNNNIELLKSNSALEKYARELFFMKKDNEDIFVVLYQSNDNE